jgi:hypothetical protein
MLDFGTLSGFTIPYTNQVGSQDYLNFLDSGLFPNDITITGQTASFTGLTGSTTFTYIGIGGSRLNELKKYGGSGFIQTLTSGSISGTTWTGYTFTYSGLSDTSKTTTVYYRDYSDGTTMITGNTSGFTKEEVINTTLTRNEHFLGFVEQPTVYSDVFIERGKQGVMEKNLRLGEIDNLGELNIYGNGFFKVKTQ